jgi:pimeloyl-ACP methyl ester carboxylesterase
MDLNEYPILILHGWGSSSERWQAVKDALSEKGYTVFVPNLPGFGDEPPPQEAWSVEDYAEWVFGWTERQNLSAFFLAGHSFGGGIAAVFAAKYPQKVKKLIFISAAIVRRRTFKHFLFLLVSKIAAAIFLLPPLSRFRATAQKLLYRLAGTRDYYRLTKKAAPLTMKETFKRVIQEDLRNYLKSISCPTFIVWGREDKVTPLSDALCIQQSITNSQLKVLPGIGHAVNLEAPRELAEQMHQFLNPHFF